MGQVTPGALPHNPARSALARPVPPLLLTRPEADAARFAAAWRARAGEAARVIVAPVVGIEPFPVAPAALAGRDAVFTSANGVAAAGCAPPGTAAWCVGARTAAAAEAAGFAARDAGGSADDLVEAILSARPARPLVHLRGREARGDVAGRLRAAGIDCTECIAYAQTSRPLSAEALAAFAAPGALLVPLFSARSAERLCAALGGTDVRAELRVAAMSEQVARAWAGPAPAAQVIAARPDADAMLDALVELAKAGNAP